MYMKLLLPALRDQGNELNDRKILNFNKIYSKSVFLLFHASKVQYIRILIEKFDWLRNLKLLIDYIFVTPKQPHIYGYI